MRCLCPVREQLCSMRRGGGCTCPVGNGVLEALRGCRPGRRCAAYAQSGSSCALLGGTALGGWGEGVCVMDARVLLAMVSSRLWGAAGEAGDALPMPTAGAEDVLVAASRSCSGPGSSAWTSAGSRGLTAPSRSPSTRTPRSTRVARIAAISCKRQCVSLLRIWARFHV